MATTNERQRAAARARLEKEMAERAAAARKRRQLQASIGAGVALLLVIAGSVWLVTSLGNDDKNTAAGPGDPSASAAPGGCVWTEVPKDQRSPTTKDVGLPPTTTPPSTGTQVMTISTNFGDIKVTMDLSKVPCTGASFAHLASKNFYDGTKCHRILPGLLQCGDPAAKGKGYRETDGQGGPTYRFADENLPTNQKPAYPSGVVAMANGGPGTNGSQFFIVYKDTELQPAYTVLGKVTTGLDVVEKATAAGHDGAFDPQPGGGHPKSDVEIKDITVGAA